MQHALATRSYSGARAIVGASFVSMLLACGGPSPEPVRAVRAAEENPDAPYLTSCYQSGWWVEPGTIIDFQIGATDPNDLPLTYEWSSTHAQIMEAQSPAVGEASLVAPFITSEEDVMVTVTVRNSLGLSVSETFELTVDGRSGHGHVRGAGRLGLGLRSARRAVRDRAAGDRRSGGQRPPEHRARRGDVSRDATAPEHPQPLGAEGGDHRLTVAGGDHHHGSAGGEPAHRKHPASRVRRQRIGKWIPSRGWSSRRAARWRSRAPAGGAARQRHRALQGARDTIEPGAGGTGMWGQSGWSVSCPGGGGGGGMFLGSGGWGGNGCDGTGGAGAGAGGAGGAELEGGAETATAAGGAPEAPSPRVRTWDRWPAPTGRRSVEERASTEEEEAAAAVGRRHHLHRLVDVRADARRERWLRGMGWERRWRWNGCRRVDCHPGDKLHRDHPGAQQHRHHVEWGRRRSWRLGRLGRRRRPWRRRILLGEWRKRGRGGNGWRGRRRWRRRQRRNPGARGAQRDRVANAYTLGNAGAGGTAGWPSGASGMKGIQANVLVVP